MTRLERLARKAAEIVTYAKASGTEALNTFRKGYGLGFVAGARWACHEMDQRVREEYNYTSWEKSARNTVAAQAEVRTANAILITIREVANT